jgi:hypothetical protein
MVRGKIDLLETGIGWQLLRRAADKSDNLKEAAKCGKQTSADEASALQNDCIPREHAINGRVGSFRRIGTASPGSYMRLISGSTVRVRPKSQLEMGMLTR